MIKSSPFRAYSTVQYSIAVSLEKKVRSEHIVLTSQIGATTSEHNECDYITPKDVVDTFI